MDSEVYTLAAKNTLNEIRNVCPEITSAFMFREDGELIAGDNTTSENLMVKVVNSSDTIFERADAIGGVEDITLEGDKGRLNITRVQNAYLVTVTSEKADVKIVNTITHVMIPTIFKLLEKVTSTSLINNSPPPLEKEPKFSSNDEIEEPVEEFAEETSQETIMNEPDESITPEPKLETKPESSIQEPPVNQLIVENLGGLLVPSDTVRIDNAILTQWESLYEGSKIEEVEIETFDGKTTRCKVKPIKDSKYEGKGIMQMPEKVQLALEIKKGELVKAKPIMQNGD